VHEVNYKPPQYIHPGNRRQQQSIQNSPENLTTVAAAQPTTTVTAATQSTISTTPSTTETTLSTTAATNNTTGDATHCEAPSVAEFPNDLFTQHQRTHGAFLIHVVVAIYMCVALAIICDYYFVPSLEVLCYKLDLQADVAGASFMAIGSSAPELFASIIGELHDILIHQTSPSLVLLVGALQIFLSIYAWNIQNS